MGGALTSCKTDHLSKAKFAPLLYAQTMATQPEVDMDKLEKKIAFMLVGDPGIGKSFLANEIIGTEVVPASELGAVLCGGHTKKVTKYTRIHEESGVTLIVYDTPGLSSEDPEIDDRRIIDVISDRLHEINVVLFCVKLDQDRLLRNTQWLTCRQRHSILLHYNAGNGIIRCETGCRQRYPSTEH